MSSRTIVPAGQNYFSNSAANTTQNLFAPIKISVQPIDKNRQPFEFPKYTGDSQNIASGFLDYEFDSNILVPADTFNFSFAAPNDVNPYDLIKEGDKVFLIADVYQFATGIIDSVELRVDAERGEIVTIKGRDYLGQLADQSAVNDAGKQLFQKTIPIETFLATMLNNTQIDTFIGQNTQGTNSLQAPTMPEESKLSVMVTYLASLNYLFWMQPDGSMKYGQPNFLSTDGVLQCNRDGNTENNNVLSYRISRSATQIPNQMVVFYSGQEYGTQTAPILKNLAARPSALFNAGYHVTKATVNSFINSTDATSQNLRSSTTNLSGAANLNTAYAARLLARANMQEIEVEIEVPGHLNANNVPYQVDTNYKLLLDRAGLIGEYFYCYSVRYRLDPNRGQTTVLNFCKQNCIVYGGHQSSKVSV